MGPQLASPSSLGSSVFFQKRHLSKSPYLYKVLEADIIALQKIIELEINLTMLGEINVEIIL